MNNKQLLEKSSELIALYCHNHQGDCKYCNLKDVCETMPMPLHEALQSIADSEGEIICQ